MYFNEEWHRNFVRRYTRIRLAQDEDDTIVEIAEYICDWMRFRGTDLYYDHDWHLDFCQKYLKRRLGEDRNDALNELAAYVTDWIRIRGIGKSIFEEIDRELGRKTLPILIALTKPNEWQDEDRIYTAREQALDSLYDCSLRATLAAA